MLVSSFWTSELSFLPVFLFTLALLMYGSLRIIDAGAEESPIMQCDVLQSFLVSELALYVSWTYTVSMKGEHNRIPCILSNSSPS